VLCPPLVELDDMIFQNLAAFDPDRPDGPVDDIGLTVRRWMEVLDGDRSAVERVVNHVHPWSLLGTDADTPSDVAEAFASFLAGSWRAWLAFRYPGRRFQVEVFEATSNADGESELEVTFWQLR
jgi:hypothetical protein